MEAIVIKVSVRQQMPKLWNITLKLKLMDGDTELLSKDFSERYRTGQAIAEIVGRFQEDMQEAIDNYKAEQNIFTAAQLDNAIAQLQNSLEV